MPRPRSRSFTVLITRCDDVALDAFPPSALGLALRVGHAEQPADLVQCDLDATFPIALRDPFERHLLERGGDLHRGVSLRPPLFERRVERGGYRLPRLAASLAGIGE